MKTSAPHIYTLTANLLAEHTFTYGAWAPGRTQRATDGSFQVGGKGINVTRMLGRLGASSTALCFSGGATGAECRSWLKARDIPHRAFPTNAATRIGIVVRGGSLPETTFLGPDIPPGAAALRACARFLDSSPDGRVLAVCGSLPGWSGAAYDPLRAALERWARRGFLAADTYGSPLEWLVQRPLALVKINAAEFQALSGAAIADTAAALRNAATRWPVMRWIVTSGAGPVWLQDGPRRSAIMIPPEITEVSPTGSGDVLLAGVIDGWLQRGRPFTRSVRQAIRLASANAAHGSVAEFPLPRSVKSMGPRRD